MDECGYQPILEFPRVVSDQGETRGTQNQSQPNLEISDYHGYSFKSPPSLKARLKTLLGKRIVLKTLIDRKGQDMKGKFGRILGDFMYRGKLVSKILCEEGHAVPYFGGSKAKIKAKHLKNRQKLVDLGKVKGSIQ